MAHLLHIDSGVQGEQPVSRALTARAARVWLAANPDGTVTYRDLGAEPLPHFTSETGRARMVAAEGRPPAGGGSRPAPRGAGGAPAGAPRPAEAASGALTEQVVGGVLDADTIVLGLPIYNF